MCNPYRHEYWYAHVPKLCNEGGDPSVRDCTVYFAFCQKLPAVINDGIKLGPNCTGAAVCLTFVEDRVWPPPRYKAVSYSMGQFNNFTGFSYSECIQYNSMPSYMRIIITMIL